MTAEELGQLLDELGERLGPAGERVFGLAVRYQVTIGVVEVVAAIGAALAALWIARWLWHYGDPDSYDADADMRKVIACIVLGLAFLGGAIALADGLIRLTNAEYAAIRDLLP